jgi:HAD superfamily hydrolase (TIGR01509 family)
MSKAFLFDLNGTIIDDMEFHAKAWYNILVNQLGATLTWEEVKKEMYGKNEELLIRIFGEEKFTKEYMNELSFKKEEGYQKEFFPHLKLINGLDYFFKKAEEQNIPMAIGSAAIMFNINYIIDNLNLRHYFKSIVSADDVTISKPNPETFTKCADALQVEYKDCIVFEDSPKGVEAALKAGMKAVVIKTYHKVEEFAHLPNILLYIDDYTDPRLDALFAL